MKKLNTFILFVVVWGVMLMSANIVYAGMNPPLSYLGLKSTGPAIVGEITIEEGISDPLYVNFSGECKANSFVNLAGSFPLPQMYDDEGNWVGEISFDALLANPDLLEGFILPAPPTLFGCNPDSADVMINTINQSYVDLDTRVIKAKAIILPLVPPKK